jgi:hypothetical protein
VADVSNAGGRGMLTALGAGTTSITGTYLGFSDRVTVTVTEPKLLLLQVTPASPTILVGNTQSFVATAVYEDFTIQNVTALALWESKDPSVAPVSNAAGSRGTAFALAAGTTAISATFLGVSGSSVLTVSSATIKQIQVTPAMASAPMRVSLAFTATALLSDGTSQNVTGAATWASSEESVATISTTGGRGVAFTFQVGTTTITASLAGVTGKATLTVGAQTLSAITVTPPAVTLTVGATQQYTATGNYSDGSTFPLTGQATWFCAEAEVAAVSNAGGRGLATALGPGNASIEAHFQGMTGTAKLEVKR